MDRSSEKERENCRHVFTSSTKRENRKFHVVVVQRRQRNVQKSVLHVQSCCFANLNQDYGRDPFNQNSNQSDREKWSTSKGGPVFSKLFRLNRTDPLSFGPKSPEILVEWIAPFGSCLNLLLFLPFSLALPSPSSLLKLPTEDNADTKFWGAM